MPPNLPTRFLSSRFHHSVHFRFSSSINPTIAGGFSLLIKNGIIQARGPAADGTVAPFDPLRSPTLSAGLVLRKSSRKEWRQVMQIGRHRYLYIRAFTSISGQNPGVNQRVNGKLADLDVPGTVHIFSSIARSPKRSPLTHNDHENDSACDALIYHEPAWYDPACHAMIFMDDAVGIWSFWTSS